MRAAKSSGKRCPSDASSARRTSRHWPSTSCRTRRSRARPSTSTAASRSWRVRRSVWPLETRRLREDGAVVPEGQRAGRGEGRIPPSCALSARACPARAGPEGHGKVRAPRRRGTRQETRTFLRVRTDRRRVAPEEAGSPPGDRHGGAGVGRPRAHHAQTRTMKSMRLGDNARPDSVVGGRQAWASASGRAGRSNASIRGAAEVGRT